MTYNLKRESEKKYISYLKKRYNNSRAEDFQKNKNC